MGKIKDLTGQRFGSLEVIEYAGKKPNRHIVWKCKCDCGNVCEIEGCNLKSGHTKSCGCLRKKSCSKIGKQSNYIDETGNVYVNLTVKKIAFCKNNCAYWYC